MRNIIRLAMENSDPTVLEFKNAFSSMLDKSGILEQRSQEEDERFNESILNDLDANEQEQMVIDEKIGELADVRDALIEGRTLKLESMELDLSNLLAPTDADGKVDEVEAAKRTAVALESVGSAISAGVKKAWEKILEYVRKVIAWFKTRREYNKRHRDWDKFSRYNILLDPLAQRYLSETKFEDDFAKDLMPTLSKREAIWVTQMPDQLKSNVNKMNWMQRNVVDDYLKVMDHLLEGFKKDASDNRVLKLDKEMKSVEHKLLHESSSESLRQAFNAMGDLKIDMDFSLTGKQMTEYLKTLVKRKDVLDKLIAPVKDYNADHHIQLLTGYQKDLEEGAKDPASETNLGVQKVRAAQIKFLTEYFRGLDEIQKDIFAFYSAARKIGAWMIKVLDEEIADIEKDPNPSHRIKVQLNGGPMNGKQVTQIEYYRLIKDDMKRWLAGIPAE